MILRLIYPRPIATYVATDRPQRTTRPSLSGRVARLVLEALQCSRAKTADRELRRHRHLRHEDDDTHKS